MIEILRDTVWQFIGAILAFIALLVSLWIYRKQKAQKTLVYDTTQIIPLFMIHKSLEDELEIKFRGYPVKTAYMVSIFLANRGNSPITRQDYDECVTIKMSGGGEIVSLDASSKNNIEIDGTYDENGVICIKPFLLNPGEDANIRVILINGKPKVELSARIIGGTLLSQEKFESTFSRKLSKLLSLIFSPEIVLAPAVIGMTLVLLSFLEKYIYPILSLLIVK